MAVLNASGLPSLLDHITRMDPDGTIADIVEQFKQKNAFIEDVPFFEGNLPNGHQVTTRTALPSIGSTNWRAFNQGVLPGKSTTSQYVETCGMLNLMSVVDVQEAKFNGNEIAFRASEDEAQILAQNNEIETGFCYHSTKLTPNKFQGLLPRLDATAGNVAASQIIKCDPGAGGADQSSIVLVSWGPQTVFGVYPKGTMAGIDFTDMGKQVWDDGSGKKFLAYISDWTQKIGLVVKDWRYLVRICNIDASTFSATADLIVPSMITAVNQLQDLSTGQTAFYCNRKVFTWLHLQARNAVKNSTLQVNAVEGRPVMSLMGIPINVTDGLISTEALVV